jgi:hypothetical protein
MNTINGRTKMAHLIEREWMTKAGLKAVVLYVNDSHNCGYIVLGKEHQYFGKGYYDVPDFEVHGGLTFAGNIEDVAPEGETWALGFDAAHMGDKTFGYSAPGDTFKDVDYMANECESLAEQIKESKDGDTTD